MIVNVVDNEIIINADIVIVNVGAVVVVVVSVTSVAFEMLGLL